MVDFFFKLFLSMMILPFWGVVTGAVIFPEDKIYLFAVLFGFGFVLYLHEKLLSFLTLEKVFLTAILASTIMNGAFLYFADLFIPEFLIEPISAGGIDLRFYEIPEVDLGVYGTIILLAVASGITYYLLMKLKSET